MVCHDFEPKFFSLTVREYFEGESFSVSPILGLQKF